MKGERRDNERKQAIVLNSGFSVGIIEEALCLASVCSCVSVSLIMACSQFSPSKDDTGGGERHGYPQNVFA